MKRLHSLLAGAVLALAAGPALAHPGHGEAAFASGLAHPVTGVDHMLAMVAVGLLAARRGGASLALWPVAFVAAMLAGYGLGAVGPATALVEPGILASVIVLGAMVASSVRIPAAAAVTLIAAFGLCHGFAHGAEAPHGAGLDYPAGFALSTALLHALGVGLGLAVLKSPRPALLRVLGGGVAAGGVALALVG